MGESRLEFLTKKYVETNLIPLTTFEELLLADPTTRVGETGEIRKVGKYSQWLLAQFRKVVDGVMNDPQWEQMVQMHEWAEQQIREFIENLYKVRDDLTIYDVVKRKKGAIPADKHDINHIADPWELYNLVRNFNKEEVVLTKAEVKQRIMVKGVDLLWEDDRWDVVTPNNRDAAVAISGPPLTRWCTASEGMRSLYDSYARQGRLYILRDKTRIIESGRGAGQPLPIYQFHFETQSFMDVNDHRVDIVGILQEEIGLKMFFKEVLKRYYLTGKFAQVKFPNDNASKYIMLYGFDDFFKALPEDIDELDIDCGAVAPGAAIFELPESITRFKKLETIYIRGCVSRIPESICSLTKLYAISFQDCHHLTTVPEGIADMPRLLTLNVKGSKNVVLPEAILQREINDKLVIIQ